MVGPRLGSLETGAAHVRVDRIARAYMLAEAFRLRQPAPFLADAEREALTI